MVFWGMVDWRKSLSVISSWDHYQIFPTIENFLHATSRVWTCAELEFRFSWMEVCSSDNHYITAPLNLFQRGTTIKTSHPKILSFEHGASQRCILFVSISAIFRGNRDHSWTKSLDPSLFHKNSNPSKDFLTMFLFGIVLHLVIILVKTQKPPKKGHSVDDESVRKTYAILMKLTTIMYLHESVKWKILRVRNSFFWLNF